MGFQHRKMPIYSSFLKSFKHFPPTFPHWRWIIDYYTLLLYFFVKGKFFCSKLTKIDKLALNNFKPFSKTICITQKGIFGMIKGINKQILEVTATESPYFDKIIFFVRPQAQSTNEQILKNEAEKISKEIRKPPKCKKTKAQIFSIIMYSGLGVGAGAALTFVISSLINL